ncbi:helix-turn-helix domain-containing protein [Alteribacter natronophilus]|uniref:helix-turn-helix domain-containing protein n=1 Tax=Alteribacter natronophilus TaxID=2583810 RepID=UPI00110E5F6A|nr:AraC family transcriptional regulator [Alteribacter natronophilus]TMW71259.1 helix-turn-helix transcriptional regulator [Alteribacter natronophilus]
MGSKPFSVHQHTYWKALPSFLYEKEVYEEWTVFCVEEGELLYQIGDEKNTAVAGDVIFCAPDIPMNRYTEGPLTFHFLRFTPPDGTVVPEGLISVKNRRRLETTYDCLRKLAFIETGRALEVKGHLLADILLFHELENEEMIAEPEDSVQDPLVRRALRLIQEKAFTDLSIADAARETGLSDVQFSRRFDQSVGMPPMEYLTVLRMRKARTYLIETEKTMDDIAASIGYQNGFYFSRIFKKKMGMAPSEFRRRHQK